MTKKTLLLAWLLTMVFGASAQTEKITFTTTKAVGEKVKLKINAAAADQAGVWIDLNNNAAKDTDEAVTSFDADVDYTLGAQTVTLHGKVTILSCSSNQLTALDVTQNTALTDLRCFDNQLTALDVSKNTALTTLNCFDNQLTALDVTQNTALIRLTCGKNQLTTLDVTQNTALTDLRCIDSQLTALDVSKNTKLTILSCSSNQLTTLDVTQNTALTDFSCTNNQLTALDVTQNTALTRLYCYRNQLTALDVSKNTELIQLYCDNNQLTALNVTQNTALTVLTCANNQLTTLDVSKNTELIRLYCPNNQLTALNTANGNNRNFKGYPAFNATGNSALTCIRIDPGFNPDGQTAIDMKWVKDATAAWSHTPCAGSGISQTQAARYLTLAPNPAKENVTITLAEGLQADKVVITDLSGKTIHIQPIHGVQTVINVSALAKGVYLLRVGEYSGKVMVK